MKKKNKWNKFKRIATGTIKTLVIITAFLFFACSLAHLLLTEVKAILIFLISFVLLALFGVANKGVFQ